MLPTDWRVDVALVGPVKHSPDALLGAVVSGVHVSHDGQEETADDVVRRLAACLQLTTQLRHVHLVRRVVLQVGGALLKGRAHVGQELPAQETLLGRVVLNHVLDAVLILFQRAARHVGHRHDSVAQLAAVRRQL